MTSAGRFSWARRENRADNPRPNTPACPEDGGGDDHEDHDHGGVTDDNSGAPVGMQGMMAVTMIFSVILGSLALA